MAILKKIKASTLMETLVATVLIVVTFMMSSMILNQVFYNTIKGDTKNINSFMDELHYLYLNEQLIVPYEDTYGNWDISAKLINDKGQLKLECEAQNDSLKSYLVKSYYAKN